MKYIKYLFVMLLMLIISCTEVEKFVEDLMVANPQDSTQVEEHNRETLDKPTTDEEEVIDDWRLYGEADYDNETKYGDKEKSIKLSKSANNWDSTDRVISTKKIPVEPGKSYKFKFKLKTESWPPPTIHVGGEVHDKNKRLFNQEGSYFSNSKENEWEDNVALINIPNDSKIKYFIPKFSMLPKYGRNADVWIDEISFSEINNEREYLGVKNDFNGSLTRVDKFGNIEIFRNGKWQSFFLFGIYTDKNRSDWRVYSNQGFNTNMWASSSSAIQRGKQAGLYSNLQIGQYVVDVDWLPKNRSEKLKHLESTIKKIKSDGLMNEVIFYYIDNEFYDIPQELLDVTENISRLDKDKNNKRMHPIYMLNGAYGQARKYNNLVDVTGTYVAFDRTDIPIVENFTGLQINENQKIPAVIAQINRGVGINFRSVLFGAIAKGAKGMGFWRDGGSGVNIENEPWWEDFPNIVSEINQMMPLIRESHFTDWFATCNNDELIFGSRNYNEKGHIIIANPTGNSIKASFTIENLNYEISNVKDYFSNSVISAPNKNVFTISIDARGTKIVRLD